MIQMPSISLPSFLTTASQSIRDRAAATIGAGGHQRDGAGVQQQLMERGMGSMMTQVGDAGAILGQRRGCQLGLDGRSSLMRLRSKVMGLA